jgi:chemotaxis protein MotA
MDKATLLGIVSGFILIGLSIFTQEGWRFFLNLNAFFVVMGGTASSTLINFPLSDVLRVIKVAKNAVLHKVQPLQETIDFWVDVAKKAKSDGLLALEDVTALMDDEFGQKAIRMMVDKVDSNVLEDILQKEMLYLEERHELGQRIFKSMGNYAPAFGMVGTLIGLIQMLQKLNDPSQIGVGMAIAMVTTLYGMILANLLFLPLAGKLETRTKEEVLKKNMILLAIESIQAGDNPRLLSEKLKTLIAPSQRVADDYSGDKNAAA